MEAIKIENLNFSYGNRKILQGINLELKIAILKSNA